jgi:protein gp37
MPESAISWLHPPIRGGIVPYGSELRKGYTLNTWVGCAKVTPECEFCYAESMASRHGLNLWGPGDRLITNTKNLMRPKSWNNSAKVAGFPRLVFAGSQMDWLEDRPDLEHRRGELMDLVEQTPYLRWILLTKRPQNFKSLASRWSQGTPSNVWFVASAGLQKTFDKFLPHVLDVPCETKGLSMEPLLGPIDLSPLKTATDIVWAILGGESGEEARPYPISDAIKIILQIREINEERSRPIAIYHKQKGGNPSKEGKGEDPMLWPEELRVREWPDGSAITFN